MVPTFFLLLMAALLAGSIGLVDPALSGQNTELDPIHFSQDSVVTRQPFRLTLTSEAEGTIHYSTNGSVPTVDSPVYVEQISIEQPTVIRARLFDDAGRPVGVVSTNSYIIVDYGQTIPLISIVTDWAHLYRLHDYPLEHDDNGERPVTVEYFGPGGQSQFKIEARIQIDGSDPHLLSLKKSYRLDFQPNGLEYRLFADSPLITFNTLMLRAAFTGDYSYHDVRMAQSQPCVIESIGDQVIRSLGQDAPPGQWVLVYLNGKYWGLYNLAVEGGNPRIEVSQLSKERTKAEILRQAAIVRPFLEMETERWPSNLSLDLFEQQIEEARSVLDAHDDRVLDSQTFSDCR